MKILHKQRISWLPLTLLALVLAGCESGREETVVFDQPSEEPAEVENNEPDPDLNPEAATDAQFEPAPEGKVLRHAVFFSFRDTTSEEDVTAVVDAFRGLPDKIDAIIDFSWGTNNSPEGLDDGYTHCFFLTFKDKAGRQAYLPHPAHKECR